MPTAHRFSLQFALVLFVFIGVQSSGHSQTVTAGLTRGVDNTNKKVLLFPTTSVTGFGANKTCVAYVKVWSLKDNGDDRTQYADLELTITTDANGTGSIPSTTVSQSDLFFSGDEGMTGSPTWTAIKDAFYARKFKIYVTVTINGVEKSANGASTPVAP